MNEVRPQPGPQTDFLSTPADIAIYGGAAGGGKTFGILLEPLRHIKTAKGFGAVIFRRTTPEITAQGGLWDEAETLYEPQEGTPRIGSLSWTFAPFENRITFAHMEKESDRFRWQGAQIPLIGFDELTHFTAKQFFYMLSRARSMCGIRPYVRATTNPDAESWVAALIAWWIDPETGLPIPGRSGILRWFVRDGDTLIWGDSQEELATRFPGRPALSLTFIPANLADNKILEAADPEYRAKLEALPLVDRERLLNGNWKIKPSAGTIFRREWFTVVDQAPGSFNLVRYWDMAATAPGGNSKKDPDWTVGLLMAETGGRYYVLDIYRERRNPGEADEDRKALAAADGYGTRIREEQEGGSSGKTVIHHTAKDLFKGFDYLGVPATGSKVVRAKPAASAAFNGLISIVRAPWNEEFLSEVHAFPDGKHDDQVDALSGAFTDLAEHVGEGTVEDPVYDEHSETPSFGGDYTTIPGL
jgi:predicted phage terminase large subunit-like protein